MNGTSKTRQLYDFFIKKWYLSAIFFSFSSNWFILLQFFGKKWGFLNNSGELEIHGIIISVALVLITLIFTIIKTLADVKNEDGKLRGQLILKQLLQEINSSKRMKLNKFINYAADTTTGRFIDALTPEQQIKELTNSLLNTINSLFGIDKNNIGISIIYKKNNNWEWIHTWNIENDLDINILTKNSNSTLYQVIIEKKPFLFWANKKDGIKEQQYMSGEIDKTNYNAGSIYCADISLRKDENIILQAALTLTTYNQQLCLSNDSKTIDYLLSVIMPAFKIRFQLELCLLYIRNTCK